MKKPILCAFLALAIQLLPLEALRAQEPPSPSEPTLGYPIGERFTPHHRIVAFFESLQASSPLVRIHEYGRTYEGRPLIYAVVTSAANHERLEQIRMNALAIGRPDTTTRARALEIAADTPAVVMLAFGIHGNESSSSEAAMLLARRLVAGDQSTNEILENTIVLIDPLQNPDGRERYVHWFLQSQGLEPDPNPDALQHFEPWPGGRFNHYLNDMNRDWATGSQMETRARHRLFQRWQPNVVVDFHEMSYQSNYFFPPTASPLNENIGGEIQKWYEIFGRANAEAFSERGWPFFVGEYFDLFYPGYGDSWPSLHGAIGMTYEMAGGGRGGAAVLREDGTILTLADRSLRHFTTAMATLQTAAANRGELLMRTYDALAAHVRGSGVTWVILPYSPNFQHALSLLESQGVEIGVLDRATQLRVTPYEGGSPIRREFPAGSALISSRQPQGGLVKSLMERNPKLPPAFIEGQRRKIDADESDDFYDITAWAVPLAHNLEVFTGEGSMEAPVSPWRAPASPASVAKASFGYMIDGRDPNVYRAVGRLLEREIRFGVSATEFRQNERLYHRGSVLIQVSNNDESTLHETIQQISAESGARLHAVMSGWPGELALGSQQIRHVRDPRIALVGGEGTSPTAFGMLWYTLDVEEKIPHSVIPLNRLASLDLNRYRVLIFPEGGGYSNHIRGDAIEKLKSWIRAGGTVVAIGGAAAFLRSKDVAISKLQQWPGEKKDDEASEPARYNDYRIPGAAFDTRINERSYLTFGIPSAPPVLLEGTVTLLPASHAIDNIVTVEPENPLLSGFAWPESIERVRGSAWLVQEPFGSGRVITFADEPYYRLFWRGTLPMFLNAALYSPTFPR
ncbi:MAG TPA: M14 family zinc carboxypeptidase [Thermoanaerobaculia bacterium]|nr:M14 family zinc carboxypeptidase [Thermoanaerobaculia bacterium]